MRYILAILPTLTLTVMACASSSPPSERSFQGQVVQLAVNGLSRTSPRIVVVDEHFLTDLGVDSVELLKQQLAAEGVSWEEADIAGDISNLPGTWDRSGPFPVNQSHVLLRVSVTGVGTDRMVQWNYTCGPLCGYGRRLAFLLWIMGGCRLSLLRNLVQISPTVPVGAITVLVFAWLLGGLLGDRLTRGSVCTAAVWDAVISLSCLMFATFVGAVVYLVTEWKQYESTDLLQVLVWAPLGIGLYGVIPAVVLGVGFGLFARRVPVARWAGLF